MDSEPSVQQLLDNLRRWTAAMNENLQCPSTAAATVEAQRALGRICEDLRESLGDFATLQTLEERQLQLYGEIRRSWDDLMRMNEHDPRPSSHECHGERTWLLDQYLRLDHLRRTILEGWPHQTSAPEDGDDAAAGTLKLGPLSAIDVESCDRLKALYREGIAISEALRDRVEAYVLDLDYAIGQARATADYGEDCTCEQHGTPDAATTTTTTTTMPSNSAATSALPPRRKRSSCFHAHANTTALGLIEP